LSLKFQVIILSLTANISIRKFDELMTDQKKMWQRIALSQEKNKKQNKKESRSFKRSKNRFKVNEKSRRDRSQTRADERTFINRSFFDRYFEQERDNFRSNY